MNTRNTHVANSARRRLLPWVTAALIIAVGSAAGHWTVKSFAADGTQLAVATNAAEGVVATWPTAQEPYRLFAYGGTGAGNVGFASP
jgi:hypothetical protein